MQSRRDVVLIIIGTCFGLGYVPVAPGTAGALLGVAIFIGIVGLTPLAFHTWLIGFALLGVCILTIIIGPWAERYWKMKDPQVCVLDEVAGFLFTVLFFRTSSLVLTVIWCFVITRIFDIIKIPPARKLEQLPAGWGILLDDLCSSVYAVGFLYIMAACFPVLVVAGG